MFSQISNRFKQATIMPILNTRFFGPVDDIMKTFLTPVMLGKQRSQMNQFVCYDIKQITEWHHLMEVKSI